MLLAALAVLVVEVQAPKASWDRRLGVDVRKAACARTRALISSRADHGLALRR
jgi:hypothetical protein